jgi:hypothetical protein
LQENVRVFERKTELHFKKEIYKIAEIRNFEMKGTIKHKDNNLCD